MTKSPKKQNLLSPILPKGQDDRQCKMTFSCYFGQRWFLTFESDQWHLFHWFHNYNGVRHDYKIGGKYSWGLFEFSLSKLSNFEFFYRL